MKKLLFKFFLLSLFACISFFTIDKVYAIDHYISPDRANVYDGTWYGDFTDSIIYSQNIQLGIHSLELTSYDAVAFDYSNTKLGLEIGRKYDFSFYVYYDYNFSSTDNSILVTVGNRACTTYNATSMYINSNTDKYYSSTAKIFSVSCSGVDTVENIRVRIVRVPVYISSSLADKHYIGISDFIYTADNSEQVLKDIYNSNQDVKNAIDKSTQVQEETNDYIKDDTAPDVDISSLGTVQGLLPEGPVDSLLNIPFLFLSVLTSSFGGVCTPLEGTFVFGSTLSIPCFSEMFYGNVPSGLMIFINLIPASFILIKYFKHLYKKVDRAVSMDSNSDDEWGVL